MPIKCVICNVRTSRVGDQKREFMAQFPLNEVRCKQWVVACGNEDLSYLPIEKLHKLRYVCGKHFKPKDFNKKKNQLKKRAIPCLNIPNKPLDDDIMKEFPLHIPQKKKIYPITDHDYSKPYPCLETNAINVTIPSSEKIVTNDTIQHLCSIDCLTSHSATYPGNNLLIRQQAQTNTLLNRQQTQRNTLLNRQQLPTSALLNRQQAQTNHLLNRQQVPTNTLLNRQQTQTNNLLNRQQVPTNNLLNRQHSPSPEPLSYLEAVPRDAFIISKRTTAVQRPPPKIAATPNIATKTTIATTPNIATKPTIATIPTIATTPNIATKPTIATIPNIATKPTISTIPNIATNPTIATTSKISSTTGSNNFGKCFCSCHQEVSPREEKLLKQLKDCRAQLRILKNRVKKIDNIESPLLKSLIQSTMRNEKRKPAGKRWSNLNKTVALVIYKKSPEVYKYLSALLPLPSIRTLRNILRSTNMEPAAEQPDQHQ